MSDKLTVEAFLEEASGMKDKITELEKKLNEALESESTVAFHGVYHKAINNRIKNICNALEMNLNGIKAERIERLEKELGLTDTIATSTAIGTDTLPKRMDSLKKKYETLFKTVHGISPDHVDNLQERTKRSWISQNKINEGVDKLREIDHEVLRELFKNLKAFTYGLNIKKDDEAMYIEAWENGLKKLGGDPKPQMPEGFWERNHEETLKLKLLKEDSKPPSNKSRIDEKVYYNKEQAGYPNKKLPSYEDFLMIHNFEVVGSDGTCTKCGANFQTAQNTPCNPTEKEPKPSCDGCDSWGLCDHQGAYKIKGKWCNELYANGQDSKPPRYRCLDCNRIWDSLELDQNDKGDLMCPVCNCTGFDIINKKPSEQELDGKDSQKDLLNNYSKSKDNSVEPTEAIKRYEIKTGKFGMYFYDNELKRHVELKEALMMLNEWASLKKFGDSLGDYER